MSSGFSIEQVQAMIDASPFLSFAGLKVVSASYDAGEITMRCPMRREFEFIAGSGQWHGGPIASLVDTVGDFALGLAIGRGLPTVSLGVDYLRPAVDTALVVTAHVRRHGRTFGVADVDVFHEDGRLLAIGRATYATGGPSSAKSRPGSSAGRDRSAATKIQGG